MKRGLRVLKWLGLGLVCVFVALQFMGPAKSNPVVADSQAIHSSVPVSPQVAAILERSCNDCHSNKTRWPWYSNVAPVSWFVIDHVNHGRSHLNFSEWGRYNQREAGEMLEEICREVKSGSMPLSSYTPLHPGSKLSGDDVKLLCDWTNSHKQQLASEVNTNTGSVRNQGQGVFAAKPVQRLIVP